MPWRKEKWRMISASTLSWVPRVLTWEVGVRFSFGYRAYFSLRRRLWFRSSDARPSFVRTSLSEFNIADDSWPYVSFLDCLQKKSSHLRFPVQSNMGAPTQLVFLLFQGNHCRGRVSNKKPPLIFDYTPKEVLHYYLLGSFFRVCSHRVGVFQGQDSRILSSGMAVWVVYGFIIRSCVNLEMWSYGFS